MCTTLDDPPLLTLNDWAAAYAGGASPRRLLDRYTRPTDSARPDPVWIHQASADELAAQLQALETREAHFASRTDAMAAMPLFGVPYALKDNIGVQGWTTTAACPAFAHTAPANAHVVDQLTRAGAICVGKTNLDQFATGLVGTRSPYGRPTCAFDADHVSGGSSSGSAVAVARGEVPFALGTDTAGSGRVPAGFNNVVGLKPTPGRVSCAGVIAACRSIDCVSVFALTVDDAASVLAAIEGPDAADIYGAFEPRAAAWATPLRIGVPAQPLLDPVYREPWQRALRQARSLGHQIVALDFTALHRTAELLYGGPWVAERHAVVQPLLDADPGAFDPTVRQIIEGARGWSATDTFRSLYALRSAQGEAAATWQQVDLLMVPTAPGHPRRAEVDADPVGANARLGAYTNFVNLLGWCALALPAGLTSAGLPFGVTFIAAAGLDAALAGFGCAWQRAWLQPLGATRALPGDARPARWPAVEPTLPLAVVGAHLAGLPLNRQLRERGATLRAATLTAPHYRLYALPRTTPPKPGLVRCAAGGAAVAVEVWDLPLRHLGSFVAGVASPLCIGSVELADGQFVHGFVCEAHAAEGATDITSFGGWRAYLQHLSEPTTPANDPRSTP